MEESTSKEKVLKNIRNALISKSDIPYPNVDTEKEVFIEVGDTPEIHFAEEFTKAGGRFVYCENEDELIANLKVVLSKLAKQDIYCRDKGIIGILKKAEIPYVSETDNYQSVRVGLSGCEYLVARLGSILVSSNQASGRRLNAFPEAHMVIAYTNQIVTDVKDAMREMKSKFGNLPSMMSLITGPSRTADIEKTLVMGAHGPRELYLFLVEKNVAES